jgi:filamentous hemagglutinin family protein
MRGDRLFLGLLLGMGGSIGVTLPSAVAQSNIVADPTVGTEVIPNFNGLPIEAIRGGAERGQNLFHSFQEFNISPDRAALFLVPAQAIQNVLARVTGQNLSQIDGVLGTRLDGTFAASTANLFLLNPNGIIFGAGAQLDVGGSFAATTANGIEFGDRGIFSATNPTNPVSLLTINPSAYLFSQMPTGSIVNRSVNLQVPNGQSLTLLGGDVALEGGRLNAWGGRVEVGAVAAPGRVEILPTGALAFAAGLVRGNVTLTDGTQVEVRLAAGGAIGVTAGDIQLSGGSQLLAGIIDTAGGPVMSRAGDVRLDATGTIRVGESSGIRNDVSSGVMGTAGNVQIKADVLQVMGGSQVSTGTFGMGDAGNVTINVRDYVLFEGRSADGQVGTGIFSTVEESAAGGNGGNVEITTSSLEVRDGAQLISSTRGQGNAGNFIVNARDRVLLQGNRADGPRQPGIFSTVEESARGNGGNVEINTGSLEVRDGAQLISSTRGQGDAGNIVINARHFALFKGAITNANGQLPTPSSAVSNVEKTGDGKAGNVQITTGSLEVLDGAQISASTRGNGNAGNVVINARDRILFQGIGADRQFPSSAFSSVEETGEGLGGNVEITTNSLEVSNGAVLAASTFGQGNAGNVVINARDLVLFENGTASSSVEETGIGRGGNVEITARSLHVNNGGQLIAVTRGKGDAGSVTINARDHVLFQGINIDDESPSTAASSVEESGIGKGGNVVISSNSLEVRDGAFLDASTSGQGDAGNVVINARDRVLFQKGEVFSNVTSTGTGKGGNVMISSGSLEVRDRAQLNVATFGQGDAGNIVITTRDRILFQNGFAYSLVESTGTGNGGNVEIATGGLEVRDGAQLISSTRGKGNAGSVVINARNHVLFQGTSTNERVPSGAISNVRTTGIGNGGNVEITAGSLEVRDGARLNTATNGKGNAGNVLINVRDYILLAGITPLTGINSAIVTDNGTPNTASIGNGTAGNVLLTASQLTITDRAIINAQTANDKSSGNITLDLGQLTLLSGGRVLTSSNGSGSAGTVTLNATEQIRISGTNSGIYVRSSSAGPAGNILLTTPHLTLNQQGRIDAQSSTVSGGNIFLTVPSLLLLRNGSAISATAGIANPQAPGDGGNVNINARFIVAIPKENSDITANAARGRGGNININSQGVFGLKLQAKLTPFSDITASSEVGLTGNILLNSPDNSGIQNSLSQLPGSGIDTNALLSKTCLVRKDGPEGTFYITGTGGIPNRPNDPALSNYPTNTVQPTTQTAQKPWKLGDPIVEPQGFYKLANGRLVMSRECNP